MDDKQPATVQKWESVNGPLFAGGVPKEIVLLVARSPEEKGRVRLTAVNVPHRHVTLALDVDGGAKAAVEQRIAAEVAAGGGSVVAMFDISWAGQGVVGPGHPGGPGPVGWPGGPDPVLVASNLRALVTLGHDGQLALHSWLRSRAG